MEREVHYITKQGTKISFGKYGWVVVTPNWTSISETDEIWGEWIKYWNPTD